MAETGTAPASDPRDRDPLIARLNELQQLIEHVPGQSIELSHLKDVVAFYLGNGKPGEFQELRSTVNSQSQQITLMKGALLVILAEISVLAPILISRWLEAHK